MGFSRNILPAGNKSPFPAGYKVVKGVKSLLEVEESTNLFPLAIKVSDAEGNASYASQGNYNVKFGETTLMSGNYQGGGSNEFRNGYGILSILDAVDWNFTEILNKSNRITASGTGAWKITITVISWLEKAGVQHA